MPVDALKYYVLSLKRRLEEPACKNLIPKPVTFSQTTDNKCVFLKSGNIKVNCGRKKKSMMDRPL